MSFDAFLKYHIKFCAPGYVLKKFVFECLPKLKSHSSKKRLVRFQSITKFNYFDYIVFSCQDLLKIDFDNKVPMVIYAYKEKS